VRKWREMFMMMDDVGGIYACSFWLAGAFLRTIWEFIGWDVSISNTWKWVSRDFFWNKFISKLGW
jgi:hypothetical protein